MRFILILPTKRTKRTTVLFADALNRYDSKYPAFGLFKRVFVFDTTISCGKALKRLCPTLRISLSIGEEKRFPDQRYPTIYTYDDVGKERFWDIVWADEWVDGLYTQSFIDACHADNRRVYAISAELHKLTDPKHSLSEKGYLQQWKNLIAMGVDGICTDYPEELQRLIDLQESP